MSGCRKIIFIKYNRDVAQPGLEYASGGRGVGSSNLLAPTNGKKQETLLR